MYTVKSSNSGDIPVVFNNVVVPSSKFKMRETNCPFEFRLEINSSFKAYPVDSLQVGTTEDIFANEKILLKKSDIGEIDVFVGEDKTLIETVDGFWFSWLAVHPDTKLYQ